MQDSKSAALNVWWKS